MPRNIDIRPKHITFGALVLVYVGVAVGLYILALGWASFLTPVLKSPGCGEGTSNLRDMYISCFRDRWYIWLFKVFLWIVFFWPVRYATCIVLGKSSRKITEEQTDFNYNDSATIVEIGMLAFCAILIAGVDYTTLPNYIVALLLRGSFTAVLALVFAIAAVRIKCKIHSFGEFQQNIFEPGSDSVALWTAGAFVLTALLQVF